MIDWSKPIETVPCERNPEPVPCEFKGSIKSGDTMVDVRILDKWFDSDGVDESTTDWRVYLDDGEFVALCGKVRNTVTEQPETPTPTVTVTGHPIDTFRHMVVDMVYRTAGASLQSDGSFRLTDASGNVIGSVRLAELG